MTATADITAIKTKSGKTLADFTVPQWFVERETHTVELILRSESMDDKERAYWFGLVEVMKPEQLEKFKGILERERSKLDDIDAKYAPKVQEDPAEVQKKAEALAQRRAEQRNELQAAEAAHEENEEAAEDAILSELENL